MILQLESLPLGANLLIFAGAAAVVWLAGTRLSRYAEMISDRTGIGKAFIGALLLGGVTSLPEATVTVVGSSIGNARLALNNIFGGVAMQVAILAVADAMTGKRALSALVAHSSVLLEGVLLTLVLALVAAGLLLGDLRVLGVGAWSAGVFFVSIGAFFLIHRHRSRATWMPDEPADRSPDPPERESDQGSASAEDASTGRIVLRTVIAGATIFAAGFVLTRAADQLAEQTGLGASFVGAILLGVSTSLPEVSATLGAVRIRQYEMAYSNIFGANILDCAILLLADVAYAGGPVLNEGGRFTLVAVVLGLVTTTIYLVGLLERPKRVFFRMGFDSLLVLVSYIGGVYLLYTLR